MDKIAEECGFSSLRIIHILFLGDSLHQLFLNNINPNLILLISHAKGLQLLVIAHGNCGLGILS